METIGFNIEVWCVEILQITEFSDRILVGANVDNNLDKILI